MILRLVVSACVTMTCIARAGAAGPVDADELEAYVDGLMDAYLDAYHTAGATVSVVKDGALFFAKGYGKMDVKTGKEVDPSTTLFRIGSVSKLFVWTAVMQQVEQGKIDLDADVNTYLHDFQIPATFPEPITMKSLMAHAPGFEDSVVGLFAKSPDALEPLGPLLAHEIPKRVRPPMVESSYSNHGTALAAHIVENVSGTEWNEYVEKNIFEPLDMRHTTFHQPLPPNFVDDMSKGYRWEGGEFVEQDFEYVPIAPAGSASATATDMAKFMIAHLQNGEFRGRRILQDATAREMHAELFQHAEGVNAMAHGFYEMNRNGQRIIGHGGDTLIFHSQLALFLDQNLGFFVSFNSAEGAKATVAFTEDFVDHYYPTNDPLPIKSPGNINLDRYTGTYRVNRYSHTSLAKIASLMQTLDIRNEDGELVTTLGEKRYWIPVNKLLFRDKDGYDTLAFRENDAGEVTRAFLGAIPVVAFEKISNPLDMPIVHALVAITLLAFFLMTVIRWPVGAYLNWHFDVVVPPSLRLPWFSRAVHWATALVFIVFYVGLVLNISSDPERIVFGVPRSLMVLLVLPLIGTVLALVSAFCGFRALVRDQGRPMARFWYIVVTLLFFVALAQLAYWNLLGFRF